MSSRIPHRELRNDSSGVLQRVQAGETLEITNHGEVVAILVPPPRDGTRALRSRPARKRGGFSTLPLQHPIEPTRQTMDELRGDR